MSLLRSDTSLMDMPRAKVAGQWITARSDIDQRQILDMAKLYFRPDQMTFLRATLAKDVLDFDGQELLVLQGLSGMTNHNLMEVADKPAAARPEPSEQLHSQPRGILQFYDFCLTLDSLKNVLRLFNAHLNNITALPKQLIEKIEQEVFMPDFIPIEAKTGANYPRSPDLLQGYKLDGNIKTIKPGANAPFATHPKTNIDKAVCEAALLKSAVFGSHQALAQGLFVIHGTKAKRLKVTVEAGLEADAYAAETIPVGQWVNAFDNITFTLTPDSYKPNPTTKIHRLNTQTNRLNTELLQPKCVDVVRYKRYLTEPTLVELPDIAKNEREAVLRVEGTGVDDDVKQNDAIKRLASSKLVHPYTSSNQSQGGAIGFFVDYWTFTDPPVGAVAAATSVFLDNNNVRGAQVTDDEIFRAMSKLVAHPISSCPQLAKAYKESGTSEQVLQMITTLQRVLEAQTKRLMAEGVTTSFNIDSLSRKKELTGFIPHCGPGFTAQFYKKTGENEYVPVAEDEAFVSRDGSLELASHVSRDKIDCVPRVSVAQLGGKASMDNLRFHPVLVADTSVLGGALKPPALGPPPSSYPTPLAPVSAANSEFGIIGPYLMS